MPGVKKINPDTAPKEVKKRKETLRQWLKLFLLLSAVFPPPALILFCGVTLIFQNIVQREKASSN